MTREKEPLLPLTGLRVFLALWVIAYHQTGPEGALGRYAAALPAPLHSLIGTGYAAVGMFFLLSGFILAYNYDLGKTWTRQDQLRFGIARFARIYPVYLLGLLLVLPFFLKPLIRHPVSEGGVGLLQATLLQSWVPLATGTWNSPGWSLSDEAFFYAVFPVLGIMLWRIARPSMLMLAGALLWLAAMAVPLVSALRGVDGLNISALAPNHHSFDVDLVRYSPLLRLPEFLIGCLTARLYLNLRRHYSGKGHYFYLPAIGGLALVLTHADRVAYPLMHNGVVAPLSACLILGLALGGGLLARLLSVRRLVFLGGASYAMYILQSPVWAWMTFILDRLHSSWQRGPAGMTVYLLVMLAVSSLVFEYLEQPANLFLKKRLSMGRARVPAAAPEDALASIPVFENPSLIEAGAPARPR